MINGDRLKFARELRGITQAELAGRIGVSQATIALIEGGRSQPPPELVEAIAFQMGLPPAFLRKPETTDFPLGSLLFRRRASMTAAEEKRVHRAGQMVFEVAKELRRHVTTLPVRLPQHVTDPTLAARATRSALGLSPDSPIKNLVLALEGAGVLILVLPWPMEGGDAFSAWVGDEGEVPAIAVSGVTTGDRLRLSVAHETGHLVLRHTLRGDRAALEREAYAFGAELLLPEVAMREEMVPPITLTGIAAMKRRWGVSMQALIRRAHDLGVITKRQYTYLFQQLSARGWKLREPEALDVPVEKPRAVRQMAEMVYGKPINYQRLALDVSLPASLVRQIIEAHADRKELTASTAQPRPVSNNLLHWDEGRSKAE